MGNILENKSAIITGSSRGVGAAIAKTLAGEGARVCINYFKNVDCANQVVQEIKDQNGIAFACKADVTSTSDVKSMTDSVVDRFGTIDIIVNNALPSYKFDPEAAYTSIETVEWDHFIQQIDGAVKGAFNTVKGALPHMKATGSGKIINISTNLVYNPVVTYYDYTTSKSGLIGLTRNLAAELGQHGITVNLIAGGLLRVTDASEATPEEIFNIVAETTPLKRTISVEEFARSVLFFASDWSNAVTGQSISVDGGLTMP